MGEGNVEIRGGGGGGGHNDVLVDRKVSAFYSVHPAARDDGNTPRVHRFDSYEDSRIRKRLSGMPQKGGGVLTIPPGELSCGRERRKCRKRRQGVT